MKKTAVVTGASGGIGLEISRVLVENNYKVYGFGRDFTNTGFAAEGFIPVQLDFERHRGSLRQDQGIVFTRRGPCAGDTPA